MFLEFSQLKDEVVVLLEREKSITLATSAQNKVTARTISHVNEDLTIYFQTSGNSEKALQIDPNTNIAFAVTNIQIEAIASKCGHPMEIQNKGFVKNMMINSLHILKSIRIYLMKCCLRHIH